MVSCEKKIVQEASDEICLKLIDHKTDRKSHSGSSSTLSFPHTTFGLFANFTLEPDGTPAEIAWPQSEYRNSIGPDFPEGHPDALYLNNACFSNQIPAEKGNFVGVQTNDITQHKPYYWPYTGSLILAAYSPHQSQAKEQILSVRYNNAQVAERMGLMILDVLLKTTPKDIAMPLEKATSFDLLHCRSIPEDKNGITYGVQKKPVNLHFKHAMSKVTFNIANPQGAYKLTDARLMNCVNSAQFYSGDLNNTHWLPNFQNQIHPLTLDYDLLDDSYQQNSSFYSVDLIVIPHQLSGVYDESVQGTIEQPVILSLTIQNSDGVGETTKEYDLSTLPAPAPTTWRTGMHYTYNITIHTHKIEFGTPTIDQWVGDDTDI